MTTKEQELKALEQIKKIVAELGEDSYVATAFEGCFVVAENNILNDWACSMKDRAETAERECRNLSKKYAKEKEWMQANISSLKEERDAAREDAKAAHAEAQNAWTEYRNMEKLANNHAKEKTEEIEHVGELESILKQKEEEIMMLKAKLYDMMTK